METKSVGRSISAVPAADAPTEQKQVEERREIVKAVKAINETELFGENYELTFVLDRETHRPLLRIIDRQTREVIRQLPPEYTLRLAEQMGVG